MLFALLFSLVISSCAYAEQIVLPEPKRSGDLNVLQAIAKRHSAEQKPFLNDELTTNEVSVILWAATGKNREPKGWTVPMAMGRAPYVSVYMITRKGGYAYNVEKHALESCGDNKRALSRALNQDYAKTAPCCLVFVSEGSMTKDAYSYMAVGAMSQNVYLAAEQLGLKARFIASFNKQAIETSLIIPPTKTILGTMVVGRQ